MLGGLRLPSLRDLAISWVLPVLLVAAWEVAARLGWLTSRILPAPSAVALAFWVNLQNGELIHHTWISTRRALYGLAIGGGIGFVLGVVNGALPLAEKLTDSTLQMLRNVPHLAIIPLVILWFGIDESAKIFLVAIGVLFPIYLNTFHGIRMVDRGLIEIVGASTASRTRNSMRGSCCRVRCPRSWSACATRSASCGSP